MAAGRNSSVLMLWVCAGVSTRLEPRSPTPRLGEWPTARTVRDLLDLTCSTHRDYVPAGLHVVYTQVIVCTINTLRLYGRWLVCVLSNE